MNPLIALALADLARAGQLKELRAIERRRRDTDALDSIQRDGRWASAIARWARAEETAPVSTANLGCANLGCATA
ncbi:MAG: hypothetical protein ABJB03_04600 [Rhodoglobus sp.]